LDDALDEAAERWPWVLSNRRAGVLGAQSNAVFTILDDDEHAVSRDGGRFAHARAPRRSGRTSYPTARGFVHGYQYPSP
jgi:hypothetical protein